MSDLDTLARAAARELLDRTTPDVASRYADLKRIRARRTAAKYAALATAVVLAVGGWQLGTDRQTAVVPASPTGFHNGALLGQHDVSSTVSQGWGTAYGPKPAMLPSDAGTLPMLQWSSDGRLLYYDDEQGRLAAWDPTTGTKQVLVPCPQRGCLGGAVSPDGSTAAFLADGGLMMADLETGKSHLVPVPGVHGGPPAWSPDGRTLAFTDDEGLHTVNADGSGLRTVRRAGYASDNPAYSVAWSPDGSRIAYFDVTQDEHHPSGRYTLVTVDPDGSDPVIVHDAGWCECGLQLPPSVAWSPDGTQLAVATSGLEQPDGIYTVRPDGSGWTVRKDGYWSWLTWQPLGG